MSTDILQLEIVYHDEDIVIVDKPGGLLSVPGRGPDKQDCISKILKEESFKDKILVSSDKDEVIRLIQGIDEEF